MSGNSFGKLFTISTFGESHGAGIGVIIDGAPAGMELGLEDIQKELDRRKPGQSAVTTPRKESDTAEILSGVFEGKTTGAPISILIRNENQRSKDYSNIKDLFRPGHADFTYHEKYKGCRDYRGGGRSSGRETACRVAAGAIAKKWLAEKGINITAYTHTVGDICLDTKAIDLNTIESNPVRCPDPHAATKMEALIKEVRATGDTIGGAVEAIVTGVPVGLGEPCFDKLQAVLAHAIFSIATIKGLEFGDGFGSAPLKGSEHNDAFINDNGVIKTRTNHAGGILGGLSSGMPITMKVAVKPTSSITLEQDTVDTDGNATTCQVHGRHDPCICPRVVPVLESMIAITLMDLYLINEASKNT
ncbi:chorismate synthase [bacterium]|jgi:chorismate synthase|nr:chorismate synthase [bacterium]